MEENLKNELVSMQDLPIHLERSTLKVRNIVLSAILFSTGFLGNLRASEIPKEPFGLEEGLLPEDIATFPELKAWALFQSYELEPDGPYLGLEDQICRMVPETGLEFLLTKSPVSKRTAYLYLDLTVYRPISGVRVRARKLSIYINGRWKQTVLTQGIRRGSNPVEIPIEPSEYPDGKLYVKLVPSQNNRGRFWGIWDAFLVENRLGSGE